MDVSTDNQFTGTIDTIVHGTVNTQVMLAITPHQTLVAMITHSSATTLDLKVGDRLIAFVNASSIMLSNDKNAITSARNQFTGTVSSLTLGHVNSAVTLSIAPNFNLQAMITQASVRALSLAEGQTLNAMFKASAVTLLKPE